MQLLDHGRARGSQRETVMTTDFDSGHLDFSGSLFGRHVSMLRWPKPFLMGGSCSDTAYQMFRSNNKMEFDA